MPKYNQDDVRRAMANPEDCRNVVLLGSMGHGKTASMDNLGAATGYLAPEKIGDQLFTLYRQDERERKCNIKCNPCHMVMESKYQDRTGEPGKETYSEEKSKKMLFTMLDAPGHIEFSPEVAAAQRMADGTLNVVDVTSGVSVGHEYMLADSLRERLKPTLFVNYLDKSIMVLEKSSEELYQDLSKIVQNLNVALVSAEKHGLKGFHVDPLNGSVIFGSAYYGWAFSLHDFAKMYADKMKVPVEKMLARMWGDQFYNAKKKTWTKVEVDDSKRGFCQFIMDPIINLHKKILGGDAAWEAMAEKLGIKLTTDDKKLEGKALLKRVMNAWMPASDALTRLMATHIPNPVQGQKGRANHIYKGDAELKECVAIDNCDKEGPLMFQCVKMTPTGSAGRFYAVGRVYSGTMKTDKYHIRGGDWDPEDPETSAYSQDGRVQSLNVNLGKDVAAVPDVPAGQICSLAGVDTLIAKGATITSQKSAYNFSAMKFNVSAVLRIAIKPADPKQLPKLVEGLKRLAKADMLVTTNSEPTGDHIIGGCGEEHLKMCLKDLRTEHAGVPFNEGVPTVSYKETVTEPTPKHALSKSPNKHNRLYVVAESLDDELCQAIEEYRINAQQDVKKRARILIDEFGWDKVDCMKLWGFGPADIGVGGANVIIDQTKGIQYLNEIRESVNSGLLWASREGPLAEENMRGCRFNLMDAKLHADSIHRGMGQIQPTARRVLYGAVLTSGARFLEPIFKCVIACPEDVVAGVRQAIAAKRGELQFEEEADGKTIITAFLPISETIGNDSFSKVLQTKSSGKAFATFAFDHWTLINADPLREGSNAEKIMLDIRERKGLKVEHPDIQEYIDRL